MDFSKILTPELFESVRKLQVPWPEDKPLDFTDVAKQYFGNPPDRKAWHDLIFEQVLKPISTVGTKNVPDLMQFLPSPDAEDFASKAVGLVALLDQGPRTLLSGANERYTYGYFDQLASTLARQLYALPTAQRPYSVTKLMEQGWSFDYAVVALIWLTAPLVHSESLEDHERQIAISEEMRKAIEEHTGKSDPHRATVDEDSKDIYGFARILLKETPEWEKTTIDEFVFWLLRLFRVHTPIIEKFEHYPYRNPSLGRVTTEEETKYLEETDYFAMMRDEVATKKIREDVEAGRWSPLTDQPESSGSVSAEGTQNTWEKLMSKE